MIIGSRINWSRLSLIVIGGQSLPSGGFNSVQLQAELGKLRWLRKENRQRHSSKVKRPRYCYYCLQKLRTIHQFSPFLETPLAYTRGSIPYRQALWMHCTLVQIKDTFLGMYHGWTYSHQLLSSASSSASEGSCPLACDNWCRHCYSVEGEQQ